MKKILLAAFLSVCGLHCNAQTKVWLYQHSLSAPIENVDSITFTNPEAVVSGKIDDYDYVDLGLPSGTLWATTNMGASNPVEVGDFYAWGETTPQNKFRSDEYKFNNQYLKYTKYNSQYNYGAVDSLSTLEACDDAATQNWGTNWRMPTYADFEELINGCDWKYSYDGYISIGLVGTSKTNSNTIFIPTSGYYSGSIYMTSNCILWTSTLNADNSSFAEAFINGSFYKYYRDEYGLNIRAVVNK